MREEARKRAITGRIASTTSDALAAGGRVSAVRVEDRTRGISVVLPPKLFLVVELLPVACSKRPLPSRSHA